MKYKRCRCERCNLYELATESESDGRIRLLNLSQTAESQPITVIAMALLFYIMLMFLLIILP
jgi:hypothetical protein